MKKTERTPKASTATKADDLDDVAAKLHEKGVEADPYYDLGPARKLGKGDAAKGKPGFLGGPVDGGGGFGGAKN